LKKVAADNFFFPKKINKRNKQTNKRNKRNQTKKSRKLFYSLENYLWSGQEEYQSIHLVAPRKNLE
jgi:hypothetical protein